MKPGRKQQIKKAAFLYDPDDLETNHQIFTDGAEWTDENPKNALTEKQFKRLIEKCEGDIDFLIYLVEDFFDEE